MNMENQLRRAVPHYVYMVIRVLEMWKFIMYRKSRIDRKAVIENVKSTQIQDISK